MTRTLFYAIPILQLFMIGVWWVRRVNKKLEAKDTTPLINWQRDFFMRYGLYVSAFLLIAFGFGVYFFSLFRPSVVFYLSVWGIVPLAAMALEILYEFVDREAFFTPEYDKLTAFVFFALLAVGLYFLLTYDVSELQRGYDSNRRWITDTEIFASKGRKTFRTALIVPWLFLLAAVVLWRTIRPSGLCLIAFLACNWMTFTFMTNPYALPHLAQETLLALDPKAFDYGSYDNLWHLQFTFNVSVAITFCYWYDGNDDNTAPFYPRYCFLNQRKTYPHTPFDPHVAGRRLLDVPPAPDTGREE